MEGQDFEMPVSVLSCTSQHCNGLGERVPHAQPNPNAHPWPLAAISSDTLTWSMGSSR